MFAVDGLRVVRISRDDGAALEELQALLARCSDYYELHEGRSAPATAAVDEFDMVPAAIPRDDIFVLGFRHGEDLVAEMSLIREYPRAGGWWIALFVVDPRFRGRGFGARVCEAVFRWIGGGTMAIAVDEQNPRGQAFWRSIGFEETGRSEHEVRPGVTRRLIIMRRAMP